MEEYKTLDKETVLAELRFAIEHKIKFSKKDLKEILSFGDIQDICNELNINAKIQPIFVDGPIRVAYYTIEFYHFYGSFYLPLMSFIYRVISFKFKFLFI